MNRLRALLLLLSLAPVACQAQTRPAEVDTLLASLPGNAWTALVENETGSVVYYQHDPNTGLAPASNTKLFTTAAAIGLLGTNYAFETRLYADGPLTNGVLNGNLNLVCFHDPTWNTATFTNARTPLDHIAAQLKALGLTAISNNVQCYGACASKLGSTDFLVSRSVQRRNADAAEAFVAALQDQGIQVGGTAAGQTGFTAPGTLLYTHHSSDLTYKGQPLRLDIACIPLLKVSHNVMADLLCRHLGWKLAGEDSYTAGAPLVLQWLAGCAGLNTNGMVLNDGSGLSRRNRFSAAHCVALTRYMLTAFPTWQAGLPVGCVDGTIGKRFCGTPGASQVHAKTGSLGIAISLSGYLDNKFDHERYLFSFIANRTNIDQTATRHAIDQAVLQFAAPPPVQPQVVRTGEEVSLTWTTLPGLKYHLQYKDSLAEPEWHTEGSELTTTNAAVLTVNAYLNSAPQRFFRILATE